MRVAPQANHLKNPGMRVAPQDLYLIPIGINNWNFDLRSTELLATDVSIPLVKGETCANGSCGLLCIYSQSCFRSRSSTSAYFRRLILANLFIQKGQQLSRTSCTGVLRILVFAGPGRIKLQW